MYLKFYAISWSNMGVALKRVISIVLIGFLCLHFSFILLQSLSAKVNNTKFFILSKAYFSTFFHQNWNVFVPAPNYQHYLLVRHKERGNWSKWEDILGTCVENNRQNKFLGNESITLLFSNSLIYELNVLPDRSTLYQKTPFNKEFTVLQHEISHYLKLNKVSKAGDDYELMILSSKRGTDRVYYFKSLSVSN